MHTHIHTSPHIFIHLSTVGHFNCFHILATVNNALVKIYFLIYVFLSFGYIPRKLAG